MSVMHTSKIMVIWCYGDYGLAVCIYYMCTTVLYQGQGQRSTSRSLHSKIVKMSFLQIVFTFFYVLCFAEISPY